MRISSLGVNIAILKDQRLLLTQREDFEVWCMPGGGVDEGESLAQAAIREAHEETGLEVRLTRLVGIYSQPNWHTDSSHIAVFAAEVLAGELRPQAGEVINIAYFDPQHLPHPVLFGQHQRIRDVFEGTAGAVWSQGHVWPFDRYLSRQELYALRDRSGLSRLEFYLKYFGMIDGSQDRLEVPAMVYASTGDSG